MCYGQWDVFQLLMEEKNQQVEAQQEEAVLTGELVGDLLQLLANSNPEVQKGTISAILQYTPSPESRRMFAPASLIPILHKYVFTPKLTTITLSALIHFAGEPEFLPHYLPIVEPVGLKLKEWTGLELQLALLLLLNVSKEEAVISELIGQDEKQGYLVEILYALLENASAVKWIISGIFVNLSSFEKGRKFLVQEKVYTRFVPFIVSFDVKLREATLKVLRNCAFEWQDEVFATDILKEELKMLNLLGRLMTFLLHHRQLITNTQLLQPIIHRYFGEQQLQTWQKWFKTDSSRALGEVELAIDIVLILSNAQMKEKAVGVDRTAFKQLLHALKYTKIKEEFKDKLEALEIFCF